jgi:hypothetical protein
MFLVYIPGKTPYESRKVVTHNEIIKFLIAEPESFTTDNGEVRHWISHILIWCYPQISFMLFQVADMEQASY